MAKLTPTQQKAVDLAREHGGELHYYLGGYWSYPGWRDSRKEPWVTRQTVNALLKRGVVTEVEWDRRGQYLTRVRLVTRINEDGTITGPSPTREEFKRLEKFLKWC